MVEVILTGYENLNIKEKINFRKKSKKQSIESIEFNNDELSMIIRKCKENCDLESLVILLLIDTGCTITEIIGLGADDIYLTVIYPS